MKYDTLDCLGVRGGERGKKLCELRGDICWLTTVNVVLKFKSLVVCALQHSFNEGAFPFCGRDVLARIKGP
ncbi:MAG: hypothetical protein WD894_14490, partial [Pirellulales bacterium]